MGSIGLTVGAQALLPDGNEGKQPDNKTNIEMENESDTSTTKRDEYLQELRDMSQYDGTENLQEELGDTHIVNEILNMYNDNLLEQAKIDKDDLGIILQNNFNEDSHVIKNISEDGEITYEENDKKSDLLLEEGDVRLSRNDIGAIYVLVDKQNMNTVAGVGRMDGGYHELNAESIMIAEYSKNDSTYVGLPEGTNEKEAFEDFSEYYQERLNKIEKDEQEELEQDNELEY